MHTQKVRKKRDKSASERKRQIEKIYYIEREGERDDEKEKEEV